MKQPGWIENYTANRDFSALVCHVILILMMGCVGYGLDLAGYRIFGVSWRGGYFLWFALLFSIEAVVSARNIQAMDDREKLTFRIAEILTLAIIVKVFLIILNPPLNLQGRLTAWEENFIDNFLFEDGFLAVAILLYGFWGISGWLSNQFDQLHDREQDAVWDELGKLQNALADIRGRIFGVIAGMGLLVVACAILARLNLRPELTDWLNIKYQANTGISIANVLAFFVLALLLFSQTQFALLRTRWSWNKTPISSSVAKNWLRYSVLFLAVLGLFVFFMPTNYALGFLQTIRYALNILFFIGQILLMILTLPLTLCARLFPNGESQPILSPPSFSPSTPPEQAPPPTNLPFWDFLRSAAFWLALVGIVIFALYQYASANKTFWLKLSRKPFVQWFNQAFKNIWSWMRGVNRQVAVIVKTGLQRFRPTGTRLARQVQRQLRVAGDLTARERIRILYLNLLELGKEHEVPRQLSETPNQYRDHLAEAVPEAQGDIDILTEAFLEARYSNHFIEETQISPLRKAWDHIQALITRSIKP